MLTLGSSPQLAALSASVSSTHPTLHVGTAPRAQQLLPCMKPHLSNTGHGSANTALNGAEVWVYSAADGSFPGAASCPGVALPLGSGNTFHLPRAANGTWLWQTRGDVSAHPPVTCLYSCTLRSQSPNQSGA